jgi:ABC-type multidrug transport system ATPase subunit
MSQQFTLYTDLTASENIRFYDGVHSLTDRDLRQCAMAHDGVTVLVTTHYMDEAELCRRIGFISQGRLIALDTPERVKETRMARQVLEISTPQAGLAERALRVLRAAQASGEVPLAEVGPLRRANPRHRA